MKRLLQWWINWLALRAYRGGPLERAYELLQYYAVRRHYRLYGEGCPIWVYN